MKKIIIYGLFLLFLPISALPSNVDTSGMVLHPYRYNPGASPFKHFSQNLFVPKLLKKRLTQFAKKIEKKDYKGLEWFFSSAHVREFLKLISGGVDSKKNYLASYIEYSATSKTGTLKSLSQLKQVYFLKIYNKGSYYKVETIFMLSKTDIFYGTLFVKKGSLLFFHLGAG